MVHGGAISGRSVRSILMWFACGSYWSPCFYDGKQFVQRLDDIGRAAARGATIERDAVMSEALGGCHQLRVIVDKQAFVRL